MSERDKRQRRRKSLPAHMQRHRNMRKERTAEPQPTPKPRIRPEVYSPRQVDSYLMRRMNIGLLTMGIIGYSKMWNLHQNDLLYGYAKDFLGPLGSWYAASTAAMHVPRLTRWALSKRPLVWYGAYAVLFEGFQYLTRSVEDKVGGRFDWWDLGAWAAGTAFAIAVDRFIKPKVRTDNPQPSPSLITRSSGA